MAEVEEAVSVEGHVQRGRDDQSERNKLGILEASLYCCQTLWQHVGVRSLAVHVVAVSWLFDHMARHTVDRVVDHVVQHTEVER